MPYSTPPDLIELIITVVLSIVSALVAISRRILQGYTASCLWVFSEFCTAILFGYLMYNAYPTLEPYLPDAITLTVAVALSAHSGGRLFQESEAKLLHFVGKRISK